MSRRVRPILVSILLTPCISCRTEHAEDLRAEAGRVAEAVRKVREAPNQGKAPLLKALEATVCTADDVCALKKSCADAYSLQTRALDGISAVRRETAGGSPAEPVPSAAAALLTTVSTDLERAEQLAKACADREGALRRKYSL